MNFKFAVRIKDRPQDFFGIYTFDGIPASKPELAEARLWDEVDIDVSPYNCEFIRLVANGFSESRRLAPEDGGWKSFKKTAQGYYEILQA